jgi:hypothetical protein
MHLQPGSNAKVVSANHCIFKLMATSDQRSVRFGQRRVLTGSQEVMFRERRTKTALIFAWGEKGRMLISLSICSLSP